MNDTICITTLVENTVNTRELLAEHGLSFYIQTGTKHILMDAGQTQVLRHDAPRLGIGLESLDARARAWCNHTQRRE